MDTLWIWWFGFMLILLMVCIIMSYCIKIRARTNTSVLPTFRPTSNIILTYYDQISDSTDQTLDHGLAQAGLESGLESGLLIYGSQCNICYSIMTGASPIMRVIPCCHSFHKDCILTWFDTQYASTGRYLCPMCMDHIPTAVIDITVASIHVSPYRNSRV
jgi:hypothetical protein